PQPASSTLTWQFPSKRELAFWQTISFISLESSATGHATRARALRNVCPFCSSPMSICRGHRWHFQSIDNPIPFQIRIGNPRSIFAGTLNLPPISTANQFQLASLAPPLIHFSRESHPNLSLGTQLGKIGQQGFVGFLRERLPKVVGVKDEAGQTVFLKDQSDLAYPQVNRMLLQDMK